MNKANFDRANVIHRELNRLKLLKKDLSEGMHVFPVVIRARIPEKIQEECASNLSKTALTKKSRLWKRNF